MDGPSELNPNFHMSEGVKLGTPGTVDMFLRDSAILWLGMDVQLYSQKICKVALTRKGPFTSIAVSCSLMQSCRKNLQVAWAEDWAVSYCARSFPCCFVFCLCSLTTDCKQVFIVDYFSNAKLSTLSLNSHLAS